MFSALDLLLFWDFSSCCLSWSQFASFSSYPGMLVSTDDFYLLTSSGLAVFETTLTVSDDSGLGQSVRADGGLLFGWMRSSIANRLARTPLQWTNWIAQSASGTFNSQWFVIDHNRVRQAQAQQQPHTRLALLPGSAIMVEQLPSLLIAQDVSEELNQIGHVSSFNVPRSEAARDGVITEV